MERPAVKTLQLSQIASSVLISHHPSERPRGRMSQGASTLSHSDIRRLRRRSDAELHDSDPSRGNAVYGRESALFESAVA